MTIDIAHDFHNGFFDPPDQGAQIYLFYKNEEMRGSINRYISFMRKKYLINYDLSTSYTKTHLDRVSSVRYLQEFLGTMSMITEIKTMTVGPQRTTAEYHGQEGELLVRGIADYNNISSPEVTSPFALINNVDKYRCTKGDRVKFRALYQDILGRDAEYVKVVIGGKTINMEKTGKGSPAKGVQYECEFIVDSPDNDYYVVASNGVSSRRIPETHLQYGPYIPTN